MSQPTQREIKLKNENFQAKFGQRQPAANKTKGQDDKQPKDLAATKVAPWTKGLAIAFISLLVGGCESFAFHLISPLVDIQHIYPRVGSPNILVYHASSPATMGILLVTLKSRFSLSRLPSMT